MARKKALKETILRDISKNHILQTKRIKILCIIEGKSKNSLSKQKFNKIYDKNVIIKEDMEDKIYDFIKYLK